MKRRELLMFGAGTLAIPSLSFAQAAGRVWRIGVLNPRTQAAANPGPYPAFFNGMRDIGYVEGKNITVYSLFAENHHDRLPALAAELVKQKVDVIVTNGTPAISAAKQATSTIPIVALTVADPVASGFAASLARPGGNITGLTVVGPQIAIKRLEIVAAAVPGVRRIGFLVNPDNAGNMEALAGVEAAARKTGREIVVVKARTVKEISDGFDVMARERVGAVFTTADDFLSTHAHLIGKLALQSRLPLMTAWTRSAEFALLTYVGTFPDFGRRAALIVDKIFKGAKAGDLPFEEPSGFDLVVNLKYAKAIGIKIPESVLLQATRVTE